MYMYYYYNLQLFFNGSGLILSYLLFLADIGPIFNTSAFFYSISKFVCMYVSEYFQLLSYSQAITRTYVRMG